MGARHTAQHRQRDADRVAHLLEAPTAGDVVDRGGRLIGAPLFGAARAPLVVGVVDSLPLLYAPTASSSAVGVGRVGGHRHRASATPMERRRRRERGECDWAAGDWDGRACHPNINQYHLIASARD